MRTRDQTDEITALPPPPAPTARDANPWPVAGTPEPRRRVPSVRTARGRDPGTRKAREGLRNVLAIGVVAFIILSGVLEALQGGGWETLVAAAVPLLVLGILFLARRHKPKQRDRSGPVGRGGQG